MVAALTGFLSLSAQGPTPHRLDFDPAKPGDVGGAGTRLARSDHAGEDVEVLEAAPQVSEQGVRERDLTVVNVRRVHQLGGQDENGMARRAKEAIPSIMPTGMNSGLAAYGNPQARCLPPSLFRHAIQSLTSKSW